MIRPLPARRRALLALTAALSALMAGASARAQPALLDAPNVVPITPRLVTSGQPTARALAQLGAQGYGAVIYLAPPTVSDAVPDEAGIVQRQGLAYTNIPIRFNRPTEADFEAFTAAMARVADRKVLVHCQVNMRASSMVFLYRVLVGQEPPEQAYEAVARVWSPEGPWKTLMVDLLRRHRVAFQPY